ncbi:diadenosine tetraphosphate hydrolase [Vibrio ishigakensis]|uniref:Diadenosine tetraphosphate hydrolase n=1 Tax=Vibrio ishigakensis TaxID=1481914 RepID=A0A0B8Q3S7_9VIBR|nr:diadenosine tetraphosphate hydrolase [Vibrio ishigakensis]
MPFSLHSQLAKDTDVLGHFPLSIALLHKDSAVPWVILVPQIADLKEIHHMSIENQQAFMRESQAVMEALESLFNPDKLNFGALGNMVPQLHVHHIARFKSDMAWPGPVWGNTQGEVREESAQQELLAQIKQKLGGNPSFSPS